MFINSHLENCSELSNKLLLCSIQSTSLKSAHSTGSLALDHQYPEQASSRVPLSARGVKDICARISLESWRGMWPLAAVGGSRVPSNEAAAAFHTPRDTRKTQNEPCFLLKRGKQMIDADW